MPQTTLVFQLAGPEQALLRQRLEGGDFTYRPVDHAHFSARGEGVVATLYRSGKLVVQGASSEAFAVRYLEDAAPAEGATPRTTLDVPADIDLVGCDEAGKGDWFGPLVAVAVRLTGAERAALREGGVADSKRLADSTCLRLGAAIRERYPTAIEALDPPEYNEAYARTGNLNDLLADLHARCIRRVARPGDAVLVDRFARESLLEQRLSGANVQLHQRVRAEAETAVAAASLVARAVFLERLAALSDETAVDLAKGAGDPADDAARRFTLLHGREALGRVAKLHFKNTQRLDHG